LFSRYAEDFQGLAGRAAVFHEQFAHTLATGALSYAAAEAANASSLLQLIQELLSPQSLSKLLSAIQNLLNTTPLQTVIRLLLASPFLILFYLVLLGFAKQWGA
jgi:hypothetical protein